MIKVLIEIESSKRSEFIDITSKVRSVIKDKDIREGVVIISVPHTTAGVIINEGADPDVVNDIGMWLEKIVPEDLQYRHLEGNSPAHIKSMLTGASVSVGIENGILSLGTWQSIFFCEFDGPRSRKVWLMI